MKRLVGKKPLILCLIAILSGWSNALALKHYSREFEASSDLVYTAILKVVQRDYFMLGEDRHARLVSFEMESHWNNFRLNATVIPAGDGHTTVEIAAQKAQGRRYIQYGTAKGTAQEFFKRLQREVEQLEEGRLSAHPQHASLPVPPSTLKLPRTPTAGQKPPSKNSPQQVITTVIVKSAPDGADIRLDGNYAGSTTSTLRLKPGKYAISVAKPGFKTWRREITLTPSAKVTVNATLEKLP